MCYRGECFDCAGTHVVLGAHAHTRTRTYVRMEAVVNFRCHFSAVVHLDFLRQGLFIGPELSTHLSCLSFQPWGSLNYASLSPGVTTMYHHSGLEPSSSCSQSRHFTD